MKVLLIIVSVFINFIICSTSFSQNKDDIINDIRERIEDIHLDTSLKNVTLQNGEFLENMTDGGGELTGFYKGNRIYRIYQSVGISHGVYLTEFYYRKNRLIFIRDKFSSFVFKDSSGTLDYTKSTTTFSGNYYFSDQRIIYRAITGHNRLEGGIADIEKSLIDESDKAFNLIELKIKSIPGTYK